MRVRHYVDFDSLHRTDNGRHERNAPINISRLAATIASAALGMSDPCTSEVPSPRGIESSLFTTQRLGAVTDGPATTTGGPYAHRAQDTQDTQGHGLGRDVSFHSRTTRSVSDDSTIREPIAAFRMRTMFASDVVEHTITKDALSTSGLNGAAVHRRSARWC